MSEFLFAVFPFLLLDMWIQQKADDDVNVLRNRASRTPSTASSARGWKKIGMGARRLSIWAVRGRICFTRRRILGIIERFSVVSSVELLPYVRWRY